MRTTGVQDWRTPSWLWRLLNTEFQFTVDAAASSTNKLCHAYFGPDHPLKRCRDATAVWWTKAYGKGPYYLNPPFQNIAPFLQMALHAGNCGATVVCLLPARVDVGWAHEIVYPYAREVRFVRGRVRYYHSAQNGRPNFPSMVVVFGPGLPKERLKVETIER